MISNKEHADSFLAYYYKTEKRQKASVRRLAKENGFGGEEYAAEIEDELLVTLAKCYKRIIVVGLKIGVQNGKQLTWNETYEAYFYGALKRNLLAYADKKRTQWKREATYLLRTKSDLSYLFSPDEEEELAAHTRKRQELEDITQEAVDQLPAKYQDVLYMLTDGLSYKDIEKVLALSTGKVKMRIMTARKKVKLYVKDALGIDSNLRNL